MGNKPFFSKKDKKLLIKCIRETNPNNESDAFDLGKMLRDYGFMIMANVIRENE